jgi:transcriptional regulator with XRE-family HTH domain
MPQRSTVEVNGANIRAIRKLAGLDMPVLAATAAITPNYLSRIETGSRNRVRPSVYAALRDALGATDDEILAAGEVREQRPE